MRNIQFGSQVTHADTAWLVNAVPVALAVAALILIIFVLHDTLMVALLNAAARRARRARQALPPDLIPDPALFWTPPAVPPATFLLICATASITILVLMSCLTPMFVTLLLAAPITVGLILGLMRVYESRYVTRLDKDLTASVGRMSALLRSANGFRQTLEKLLVDMPEGPLKREWGFLLERQGMPLTSREGIATAQQVVAALAVQTPSRRHAAFLNHLAVAVGQPQDVLVTRVAMAYDALQKSERRREEAVTQLAQMRYSGMAVGGAGLFMATYLVWTQWERVVIAYTSPLAVFVGPVVVFSLLLPIVGGFLLAQADDVDY